MKQILLAHLVFFAGLVIVTVAVASEACPAEPTTSGVFKFTGTPLVSGSSVTISNPAQNHTWAYKSGSHGNNYTGSATHTNEYFMIIDDPCQSFGGTCVWKIKWKYQTGLMKLYAKTIVFGNVSKGHGFSSCWLVGEAASDSNSARAQYETGEELTQADYQHAENGGLVVDKSGLALIIIEENEKGILDEMTCYTTPTSMFDIENSAYAEGETKYTDPTWTKMNVEFVSGVCEE